MAGKIQNEDIKTSAELVSAGGTAAQLPNDTKVYVTANTLNKTLYQAITDGDIGGGSGGLNYIPFQVSKGATLTGTATYANAAGTAPVNGTGGSPSSTLAVSTNSSLVSTTNFLWTKSAANRQGEGWSVDIAIDQGYQAKPFSISFMYSVASGTYADGDMTVWMYDITNSVLIQPSSSSIQKVVGTYVQNSTFQAPPNSTSLRFIVHTSSVSALAYSLRFDSISVGPSTSVNPGAVVTDWALTTGITASAGFGTVTLSNIFARRVGDAWQVRGSWTNGTLAASAAFITLPYTVDTAKVTSLTQQLGIYQVEAGGTNISPASTSVGYLAFNSSNPTQLYFSTANTTSGYTAIASASGSLNTGIMNFEFTVPILGWTSGSVASVGQVAALITGTPANTTTGNPVIFPTVTKDTAAAYNNTTGLFTAPFTGFYDVASLVSIGTIAAGNAIYAYVNGSIFAALGYNITANSNAWGAATVFANAGDTISIRHSANASGYGTSYLSIVYAPTSVPSVNPVVKASYYQSAATNTPGAVAQINYDTKIYDSHGAVTTGAGAWKFTAPINGTYRCAPVTFCNASTYIRIFKNGSSLRYITQNSSTIAITSGCADIQLLAGDYIDIRTDSSVAVAGGPPSTGATQVDIIMVGNY